MRLRGCQTKDFDTEQNDTGRCDRSRPVSRTCVAGYWESCWYLLCGVIERQWTDSYVPPGVWINRIYRQNFQYWKVDKISENSGLYPTFSVCPIITHSSTRLTIPVAFITVPLFLFGLVLAIVVLLIFCRLWGESAKWVGGGRKDSEKYVVFLSIFRILCYNIWEISRRSMLYEWS